MTITLRRRPIPALFFGMALVIFGPGRALAQVQPDAGRIQQELERGRAPGLAPPPARVPLVEELPRPALKAPLGRAFRVKGFRITRNTAFPEAELTALLGDFVGKEQSLADLERAAEVITRFYREHGYFVARAYVPAQDMDDGIVEITVLEGRLDRISLKLSHEIRLKESVVENTLRAALPEEGLIRLDELERGLLLLNDIPGVSVQSVLLPGSTLGTSDLTVEVKEGPLRTGSIDFDNHGSKFTGPFRLGPSLNLNDPSGRGDLLNLRAIVSEGARYARLAYQIPVGFSGFKLGGAYSGTRYRLCCDFAALEANGEAQTTTLNALYPLLRGRRANLYGTATIDARHFANATIAGTTSDKKATVVGAGIVGDGNDNFAGGGLNGFAVTHSVGQIKLDAWEPDRLADAASARSQGRYRKVAFSAARLQRLDGAAFVYAGISGQLASKNLDSSEKFTLGGPLGVRAYPAGEASGDEGLLMNMEFRYDIQSALQLALFVDHGEIRLHKNEWAGWQGANARIANRYGLSGAGIAMNWSRPGNFQVRASVAQPLGDNPGRDANDNNSDGARNRLRLWLQMVKFL